jgi:hypothetical protein
MLMWYSWVNIFYGVTICLNMPISSVALITAFVKVDFEFKEIVHDYVNGF